MQERQLPHVVSLNDRLAQEAARTRAEAETMPPGKDRDALLARAREADTTVQLNEWLKSPAVKPPRRAIDKVAIDKIAANVATKPLPGTK
jgi:hypothetical protein